MNITAVDTANQKPQINELADEAKQAKIQKFKKACQQFESLFVYYMLKTMRSASEKSSLLDSGMGNEIFTQMFDESISDKISESSPFGLGDMLMRQYAKQAGISEDEIKTYDQLGKAEPYYRPHIKIKNNSYAAAVDTSRIDHLDDLITEAADTNNIDPNLVKAVILQESGGDPKAVSPKGAKGLMQLMDATASMLGVSDPFDTKENIAGGVKYLSSLIKKFDGDLRKALAAYNAGPATVEKYNGVPPFEETKKYVSSILDTLGGLFNSEKSR